MNQNDIKALNELKMLSIDMINHAGGGHPGICLSMAPVMYSLFTKVLNVYPKEEQFFKYIFENTDKDSQMIVSSLKIADELLKEIHYDNIIELNNKSYQLLNEEDYDKYKSILFKVNN